MLTEVQCLPTKAIAKTLEGQSSMRIIIRGGKFYQGNVEMKPEFGNVEQIRALKAEERKLKSIICEAKLTEQEITQYYARVSFTCPLCSQKNQKDYDSTSDVSEYPIDNSDVDTMEVECCKCKHEFTIHADKSKKGSMPIYLSYDDPNAEDTDGNTN